jgi:hypothetical protein
MKLKLDSKSLTTLEGSSNYKRWKEEVKMLVLSLGASYLLEDAPPLIATPSDNSGSSDTNISMADPTVNKKRDEYFQENEQVVTTLYFCVSSLYRETIFKLNPKTLKNLFAAFDKQFLINDSMALITKRAQLDDIKIKADKTMSDQVLKFEEKVNSFKEAGGNLSDSDLTYLFIKALPTGYKEKLAAQLPTTGTENVTYDVVKRTLLTLWDRDMAWNLLPKDKEAVKLDRDTPATEKALLAHNGSTQGHRGGRRHSRGGRQPQQD